MGFKDEFRPVNFLFRHDRPHEFARSQYHCPHRLYIAWRVFWVLFHTGWMIRSVQLHLENSTADEHDPKWLIYLTNWSYLLLTMQSYIHLMVTAYHTYKGHSKPKDFGEESQWHHKLLWIFTNVTYPAAILVSLLFWTLVFKELKYALTVITHAINSVYAISDTLVSSTPWRILHFYLSAIYAVIYITFSIIYHVSGGTNDSDKPYIYGALDWSKTGVTTGIAFGVVLVAVPLAHLFLFGLTKFRLYCYQECGCGCCHNGRDDDDDEKRERSANDIELT